MRSIIFMSLWLTAGTVFADACLDEAKTAASECKADCKDGYKLAKDTCSNRDHVCVESCRSDRQICLQPTLTQLQAAVAGCNGPRDAAIAICRANNPDGSTALDDCIDQVQVVAFVCRKTAHKAAKPGIAACRSTFKACVKNNCPQASIPDPADLRACKDDAVGLLSECEDACTEAKQLAKDTCLQLDHACVEVCRGSRDGCRAPSEATRAADIAVCKTDRQAAFDNCRLLFGAGTPDRQTCIAQAQIAAFSCRDTARENVAAALQTCGADFHDCVGLCPPPS